MEEQDLVDVLIATYNPQKEFFQKQIESILNQTHKNIHIYISDDCSKNESIKQFLKEYEKKDKRITLIFQEKNLGCTKNFGYLLEKSTANYICYSDQDDIWYENKIEKCLKKIKEEKVDLIYCNCKQINEDEKIIHNNYFKYKNVPLIKGKDKLARSRCIGIGCSQMFTKNLKEKIIPFKESVIAHDWIVSYMANEMNGMTYIEEPLFDYRLHTGNIFGGRSLEQNLSIWKNKNGISYDSYSKYRKEKVINKAYLYGARMCLDYTKNKEEQSYIEKLIKYYESLNKSKYINLHFIKYFKFLSGRNLLKKMIKEFVIFHFPIIGYIKFKF